MTDLSLSGPAARVAAAADPPEPTPWWKSAVIYQIYPRSFADSDGDGIGDLRGVLAHLDHLRDLGVDAIWLSPIYRSPHDDNGYDVADYQDVDPVFGTLADLDAVVAGAHARGIRMILDIVVNHTSDEHPWFIESRTGRMSRTADWYIWRDPRPGTRGGEPGAEPNNWGSFFGGPAWEWVPERGQYYLHLFSKKQPDLNWDSPQARAAIFAMMNWWIDRGIDGFRLDVINFISKQEGLPDGDLLATGFGDGMPYFSYGPHVHEYLRQMQEAVFAGRPGTYLTVGEMPGVTPEQAARFTDARTGQLDMVFQFEHVELDQGVSKWDHRPATILDLKRSLGRWQELLAESGWNSLYWNNHDQPRVVSRWGNDREHRYESATALATVLHLHRGTPFVYQGEEIGMTNPPFPTIEDFRDIESLNYHAVAMADGADEAQVLEALRRIGRDNARTPVQWHGGRNAGFSAGRPWISANPNHTAINVAAQAHEDGSVLAFYRRLIRFRHENRVVVDGRFTMLLPEHPVLYSFAREFGDERLLVVANLGDDPVGLPLEIPAGASLAMTNYAGAGTDTMRPWEARVYWC